MALKVTTTNRVPSFLAMAVMNATREIEAAGGDVIHLEVGQPSTPPPDAVNLALTTALSDVATHGYSLAFGEWPLRQRIADHYGDFYATVVDPSNIAVTPGSSLGFALAFLAAFDRGDRIAITTPGYPAYRNLMLAMGLVPVEMPARAADGWVPSIEALETAGEPLPDGMLLASPANPTGMPIKTADNTTFDHRPISIVLEGPELLRTINFKEGLPIFSTASLCQTWLSSKSFQALSGVKSALSGSVG